LKRVLRGKELVPRAAGGAFMHAPMLEALFPNIDSSSKKHYLERGFNDAIPKPIDELQLESMIRKYGKKDDVTGG